MRRKVRKVMRLRERRKAKRRSGKRDEGVKKGRGRKIIKRGRGEGEGGGRRGEGEGEGERGSGKRRKGKGERGGRRKEEGGKRERSRRRGIKDIHGNDVETVILFPGEPCRCLLLVALDGDVHKLAPLHLPQILGPAHCLPITCLLLSWFGVSHARVSASRLFC